MIEPTEKMLFKGMLAMLDHKNDSARHQVKMIWKAMEAVAPQPQAARCELPKCLDGYGECYKVGPHCQQPQAEPAGEWVMVPREPTPKMIDATWNHAIDKDGGLESQNTRNRRIYAAMIDAAPQGSVATPPQAAKEFAGFGNFGEPVYRSAPQPQASAENMALEERLEQANSQVRQLRARVEQLRDKQPQAAQLEGVHAATVTRVDDGDEVAEHRVDLVPGFDSWMDGRPAGYSVKLWMGPPATQPQASAEDVASVDAYMKEKFGPYVEWRDVNPAWQRIRASLMSATPTTGVGRE